MGLRAVCGASLSGPRIGALRRPSTAVARCAIMSLFSRSMPPVGGEDHRPGKGTRVRKPKVGDRVWWKQARQAQSGVVVAVRRDGTTTVRHDDGREVEVGLDRIYRRERVKA